MPASVLQALADLQRIENCERGPWLGPPPIGKPVSRGVRKLALREIWGTCGRVESTRTSRDVVPRAGRPPQPGDWLAEQRAQEPALRDGRREHGRSLGADRAQKGRPAHVFNNYDIATDDHSLRLSLWFYDAKKYKETPAKEHWTWCQVARMAADGYEWVESSAPPAAKKRKTTEK